MSLTVYKYPFRIADKVVVTMPRGALVLHVDVQNEQSCIWALVDPSQEFVRWTYYLFGTGHPIPDSLGPLLHVATFQMMGGMLVYHLFEPLGGAA